MLVSWTVGNENEPQAKSREAIIGGEWHFSANKTNAASGLGHRGWQVQNHSNSTQHRSKLRDFDFEVTEAAGGFVFCTIEKPLFLCDAPLSVRVVVGLLDINHVERGGGIWRALQTKFKVG